MLNTNLRSFLPSKTERKTCQDNDHKGVYSYKHIPLYKKETLNLMLVVEKYHVLGLFCIMQAVITPQHSPWKHSDDFCGVLYIHLNWYQLHLWKMLKLHYKAITCEDTMIPIMYKTYMLTWLNLNLNFGRGKKRHLFSWQHVFRLELSASSASLWGDRISPYASVIVKVFQALYNYVYLFLIFMN